MSDLDGIRLASLRELAAAGSIKDTLLVAEGRSWVLTVRVGYTERKLLTERGGIRKFSRVETAVGLLRSMGINRITMDATDYDVESRQPSLLLTTKNTINEGAHDVR